MFTAGSGCVEFCIFAAKLKSTNGADHGCSNHVEETRIRDKYVSATALQGWIDEYLRNLHCFTRAVAAAVYSCTIQTRYAVLPTKRCVCRPKSCPIMTRYPLMDVATCNCLCYAVISV